MSMKDGSMTKEDRERLAAQIVAASEGLITVPQAMKTARMQTPDRKNPSVQNRVYRKSKSLVVVDQKSMSTPASASALHETAMDFVNTQIDTAKNDNQSMSSLSEPPSTGNSSRQTTNSAPVEEADAVKRYLDVVDNSVKKKTRRTPKQKHNEDAEKLRIKKKESQAMKMATQEIDTRKKNPTLGKMSQIKIVERINKHVGTNVSSKTVSQMVREGRIHVSPLKRGPAGHFPKVQSEAMCTAFVTFVKLEQANSKKQLTLSELSKRVNAMINAAKGFSKSRTDLTRKLKEAMADQFQIDQRNQQEARRLLWTTHANLRAWYNQWEYTLIDLGFAHLKTEEDADNIQGNVVFFPGMIRCIVNLDKTDGSLDNTNGQGGGRKPMAFYAPDIGGGGTQANKSSYSPTIICGSNSAGEALPPHFQLKSTAKTDARERFNMSFLQHAHNVNVQFGHPEKKSLPCTLGMNEKAGMNAEELDKYFHKSILPLYPDIADLPGSRVICNRSYAPSYASSMEAERIVFGTGGTKHHRENARNRSKLWAI